MVPGRPANTFSRGRGYRAQVSSSSGRNGRCIDLGLQEDGRGRVSGREAGRRNTDGHDSHADHSSRHRDDDGCGPEGQDGFREDQDSDGLRKEEEVTHLPSASASGEVIKGTARNGGAFLLGTEDCGLTAENFGLTAIANRRLIAGWGTNFGVRTKPYKLSAFRT